MLLGTFNLLRHSYGMHKTSDLPDDAREAFLFVSDDERYYGIALEREGSALPSNHGWKFCQPIWLGVQEALPVAIDPEPVLRGLKASGYFTWSRHRTEPFGTAQ
jgi:hypothetical protein